MEGTGNQHKQWDKKNIKSKTTKTQKADDCHLYSKSYKNVRGDSIPIIKSN